VAIRSPINPQTIVRERQATMPAAMNFISGGSPMGSSIVSSAANKIVGFQRGAAAVAPRPPDLGSIINTLSSNILNNVENRVQSINQNVSNIVNQTLKSFGKDYQDRVKQIDDAKPTGILANFLKLYKQAIEFIQFLGNRKNAKTLGDNLQVLQRIFTETFEVAKIIRQTIVKIVKQLSNLPTASTGGGGLNLDINVPGGPLRRSAPRGIMNMLKMVGAGAAVAGGGALAVNAMGSLFGGGEEVQAVPGPGSEGLSGPILDRFSAILDRFDAAISSMTKKPPAAPSAPSGGGGAAASETPPPSAPPGGPAATATIDGTFKSKAGIEKGTELAEKLVAQGFTPEAAAGLAGGAHYESAGFTADEEFSPNSYGTKGRGWLQWTNPGGSSGRRTNFEKFAKENKLDPKSSEANYKFLMYEMSGATGNQWSPGYSLEEFKKIKDTKKAEEYFRLGYLRPNQAKANAPERQRRTQQIYQQLQSSPSKQTVTPTSTIVAATPAKPGVTAASTQSTTQQQIAQTVAQPPVQQQAQVNVLPINLGNQQQPQRPTSSGAPQPAQMSSGRQSPSMNASNDDNFLTLYSKMVYNIVDG